MRLVFILMILAAVPGLGQEQIHRWEIEKKLSDNDFNVVSAEEEGLIIFRETDKYENGDKKWEIKFLNDTLAVTQEFDMYLDSDYNLMGYDYEKGYFYLLFKDGIMNDSNWFLYRFNLENAESEEYEIENEIEIELSHFLVSNGHLVMGGRVVNKPAIVHYTFRTGKVDVLPGFYKKETVLVDMNRNDNGTFNVLFLDKEANKDNNVLWLKVFSDTGQMLLESSTTFEEDLRVHSGTTNKLEGSDLVIVGTYGSKKSKLSVGMFFINVKPGTNNEVAFTDFTELEYFFRHLGDNREARIKEKIKESKSGKPYDYKATVVIWKLVEYKNNYVVFAELVDPEYQTNSRRRYYPNSYLGNPMYDDIYFNNTSNRSRYFSNVHSLVNKDVMVSVNYKQSILVAFDKEGNRLFDNSHVIDDVETPVLDQLAAYDYQSGEFQMLYKKGEELFFRNGDYSGNIEQDTLVNISTLDPLDVIKYEDDDEGKVEHWYGKYYFIWGYQRIQKLGSNERRSVFYINKFSM